jgi:hypothetical protein
MIVFPMAGLSQRFSDKGYRVQKFMLPLWDGVVFDYAVASFMSQFSEAPFLFIYRETGGVKDFLGSRTRALGIREALFVELAHATAGQAETVDLGLERARLGPEEPLTIFNIDTFRMPTANPIGVLSDVSGWLEVFRGSGDNWSFVRSNEDNGLAVETAEKVAISDLCCTGLYQFASTEIFRDALVLERASPSAKELYIAPIYNHLIARGERIGFGVVDRNDVAFCGVPEEYEDLLESPAPYGLEYSIPPDNQSGQSSEGPR